jgi:hypothetical protein
MGFKNGPVARGSQSKQPNVPSFGQSKADWLAGLVLLGTCALWIGLTWNHLYDPIVDQGWYLQAARRVAGGEVLYRDLIWMYGPLPVYLLAWLFGWWGIHVMPLLALYSVLAILGCLLTFRIARFLLAPSVALLGTLALFLGGWWGGLVGYTQAYTGAVPLGAVLGLLVVLCLLSYLAEDRLRWLVGAGLGSGAALLTKPEFGLACAGAGMLLLGGLVLFPGARDAERGTAMRGLAVYMASVVAVAGIGYAILVYQAGWRQVWLGITGYDQDAILLQVWPPWGTPEAWLYIVSGLGVYLLACALLVVVVAPQTPRQRPWMLGLAGGLGVLLAILPWRWLARLNPALIATMRSSWPALIEQGLRVFWAPGTVLLAVLLVALAIHWIRAHRQRQPIGPAAGYLVVLASYTALANIRSFLYPTGTFHFLYLDTLMPVLVFLAVTVLPSAVERRWHLPARTSPAAILVAVAMVVYAAAGLVWDVDYLMQQSATWDTPQGSVVYNPNHERRRAWPELLEAIQTHTEPGDPIAVLGQEPGFYFWTGRSNPLRQDTLLPRMASSPEDAQEIVRRMEASAPRLIAVPQGVTYGRGWFWELDAGRQTYQDLAPVWDYIAAYYEFQGVLGGDTWGYALYLPATDSP